MGAVRSMARFAWVLWLGFAGLLGLLVYLVIQDKPGQIIIFLAAALVLVATRFGDLVKFRLSGTGLEADLEKIRNSFEELHHLAELFGAMSLRQMQGSGRWGGYSKAQRADMRKSIVDGLERVGLPKDRIGKVLEAEWPFMHFDYSSRVKAAINKKRSPEINDEWNALVELHNKGIGSEADPVVLRAFVEKHDLMDDELRDLLADFDQFHKHQTHRRAIDH